MQIHLNIVPKSFLTCVPFIIRKILRRCRLQIPYSGYFSGDKIFVSSEFGASSWKHFHGHRILNHTSVLCGTVLWVKILCFASQP